MATRNKYPAIKQNNTKVIVTDEKIVVRLHWTDVVTVDKVARTITLDTNGWASITTKDRMNAASRQFDLGFSVCQRKGAWFVTHNGEEKPYTDDKLVLNI